MKKLLLALIILLTASTSFAVYPTEYLIGNPTFFYEDDEFISGTLTSGAIGKQGWNFDGSPTVTTSPLTDRPGAIRFMTPASSTTNNLCLKLCSATTGKINFSNGFDTTVIISTVSWASSGSYIGYFISDVGVSSNYIGIHARPTKANWQLNVTGSSLVDTGIAVTNGTWIKVRLYSNGSTVTCYINDILVATATTTASGQAQPVFQINTDDTTARGLDINYWNLIIPSVAR